MTGFNRHEDDFGSDLLKNILIFVYMQGKLLPGAVNDFYCAGCINVNYNLCGDHLERTECVFGNDAGF